MNREKLNRRKKIGGPQNDPTNVTYGRANPNLPQGSGMGGIDQDPRTAMSYGEQGAAFNGQMGGAQNPYGDAVVQSPALMAPSVMNGGIAQFSGNQQNIVPGTGYNQMPGQMIPSFNQAGNAKDTDGQESMRIASDIQNRGLFANAMGFANPGLMPVPGSMNPQTQQTQSTIPLQGAQGGLVQSNDGTGKPQSNKGGRRGQRSEKGMTT